MGAGRHEPCGGWAEPDKTRKKARPFELPVLPTPILRVWVARMRGVICDEDEINSLGTQSLLGTNEKKKSRGIRKKKKKIQR